MYKLIGKKYNVFISFKNLENGKKTSDCDIALELYKELSIRKNIVPFYSEVSLKELGESKFKRVIDEALDECEIIIVVGSSIDYIESRWVRYEWESFHQDILSGLKKHGEIITYVSGNISAFDLPRTLRTYQCFQKDKTSVKDICSFVENYLKNEQQNENLLQKQLISIVNKQEQEDSANPKNERRSNYLSNYADEIKRLEIQSRNSMDFDQQAINYIKKRLLKIDGINVLDIGSAYGFVAYSRFNNDPSINQVICIDNNSDVIDHARRAQKGTKLKFFDIDIEQNSFQEELKKALESCGIDQVDIVFSALTLHHLNNPCKFLRNIRNFIVDDGFILLRGSDDGSKLCYPHDKELKKILEKYSNAQNTSDRENGRKLFNQLRNSGYDRIKVMSFMQDTSQLSWSEKEQLFSESFSYRINTYRRRLAEHPDDEEIKKDLIWMENALKRMENYFYEPNFWYAEYTYIAIAQKLDIK